MDITKERFLSHSQISSDEMAKSEASNAKHLSVTNDMSVKFSSLCPMDFWRNFHWFITFSGWFDFYLNSNVFFPLGIFHKLVTNLNNNFFFLCFPRTRPTFHRFNLHKQTKQEQRARKTHRENRWDDSGRRRVFSNRKIHNRTSKIISRSIHKGIFTQKFPIVGVGWCDCGWKKIFSKASHEAFLEFYFETYLNLINLLSLRTDRQQATVEEKKKQINRLKISLT